MAKILKVFQQEFDNAGDPNVSGTITVYNHGTLDLSDVYSSEDGETPIPNPVTLGSGGRISLYVGAGFYDAVLKDSSGNTLAQSIGIPGDVGFGSGTVSTVGTIDELRGLSAGVSTYVDVTGYYTTGDGKAFKRYYWSASSTASDNNGNVIKPASDPASGRWLAVVEETITPFKFGAKGDDSTNDYNAFLSANNYCASFTNKKTLTIPATTGKYVLGTAMTFTCPVVGEDNAIIKTTNLNITFSDSVELNGMTFELGTGVVSYGVPDTNEWILNTIADLRALPSAKYKYVTVLGHTTVGDGGGGRFVYDPSSTAVDDNGMNIKLTNGGASGRYEREVQDNTVNACWFGLQGTGESGLPQSQAIMTANVKALMRATRSSSTGIGTLLIPSRNVWYGINKTVVPGAMVLATSLTGVTTSVVVDIILEEMPQTGTLYINRDSRDDISPVSVTYTSWTGSTFTITSHDFTSTPCSAGNSVVEYNKTSRGSNWKLKGEDGTIYWGGIAGGRMIEASDPYLTFVEMNEIKLRGWHTSTVSSPEMIGGGFASEGVNYGRTKIGHFHYYFSQVTGTWFLANDSASPFVLNPNGGGNNGANDFEFLNCYVSQCGSGFICGMPDQSFINCTFQNVNIVAQMGSNSRVSFLRCYLGALKAVFQISSGCNGINIKDSWFEQSGTMIKYTSPGTLVPLAGGLNITDCRLAMSLVYGNTINDYPVLLQQPSTLATALTGVTTSIVANTVLTKETTTEAGIPDRGWLRVYANGGTVYKVFYNGFTHATKTFANIKNHFRVATTLSSAGTTSVVVEDSIPAHTKSSGNLVITLDDGTTTTVAYSSFAGSTFTISSTDFSTNTSRVGRLVKADTDFTSVPASSGNLLQIQRNGSFLDTRDITGNINIWGADFAPELGSMDITIDPNYANVSINKVKNSNYWPLRFTNTSGTDIEGGAGISIDAEGRKSYGLKAKADYGSEGDLITFKANLPVTGLANGTSSSHDITVPGVILTQNRPSISIHCYDTDAVFLNARVTAPDTIRVSVVNVSGSALASSINVYGQYKSILRNEILI